MAMVKIYYSPSCSSCRKVLQWFKEQNLPYESKDIFSGKLTKNDIIQILYKSENGTTDIISTRSKIITENKIDIDSMKISELIDFVLKNPSVLKRPIIVDDRRVVTGYNEDDITVFLPRARKLAAGYCSKIECPVYENCESKSEPQS